MNRTEAIKLARKRVTPIEPFGNQYQWLSWSHKHEAYWQQQNTDWWGACRSRRFDLAYHATFALTHDREKSLDAAWAAEAGEGRWVNYVPKEESE